MWASQAHHRVERSLFAACLFLSYVSMLESGFSSCVRYVCLSRVSHHSSADFQIEVWNIGLLAA